MFSTCVFNLLNIQLNALDDKSVIEFMTRVRYALRGVKRRNIKDPELMFEWLWDKIKDWTPIKRVTDRVKRATEYHKPHRLTWKYLWNAMLAHLNHKHETVNALNLANAEAGKLGQKAFSAGAVAAA